MATSDGEVRTGAQGIERALAVLSCFGPETVELGVSELARRTNLPVPTAHRIAAALVRGGFLAREPGNERYQLGPQLAILGQAAMSRYGFALAQPILQDLVDRTGEAASLGVRDGADVVVAARVESPHALRFDRPAGSRVPLHASAMGKAILAHASPDAAGEVAALGPLAAFTPHTVASPDALLAELDRIRAEGVALNREERHEGVVGIGAPVLDRFGRARAAVAVQGPVSRVDADRLASFGPLVVAAAARLAEVLPLERL